MVSEFYGEKPLEELVDIHDSLRKPVKSSDRTSGPYPYYGASGITDYVDSFIFEGEYLLLSEDGDNLRSRNTPIAFLASGKFWVNNHAHVLQGNSANDTKYLCYALQIADITSYLSGSTRPKLNQKDMRRIPVYRPPLHEQKAIAHILGSLDDKIELNRRMNATLEGMAQALFKSWFVDFDPVLDNALVAGNPIPDALAKRAETRRQALANGSANRQAAESFPAAFQFTEELGWIPEGWEVKALDKIAKYKNGLALQKFRPNPNEIPLPIVKIAQLKKGKATWDELASPGITSECIINDGDVIFSWSGSLMIDLWCGGKAALNQHLFKVTSTDFPKWFYLSWSNEHLLNFQRIAAAKAVTMGHIKRSHLSEAYCAIPDSFLIAKASEVFEPYLEKIISQRVESKTLAKLRDTLLPKLISGELRLPNAEKLVQEALA